jgi:FeS assembly SUF system protein
MSETGESSTREPDQADELKQRRIEPLPTVDGGEAPQSEAFGGSGEPPAGPIDEEAVRQRILDQLRTIYDPEIPLNIYDLGLIYGMDIAEDGGVEIRMTLTAPACPVAGALVQEVASKVGDVDGVRRSHVVLVWDPPWTKERLSEDAMLALGLL